MAAAAAKRSAELLNFDDLSSEFDDADAADAKKRRRERLDFLEDDFRRPGPSAVTAGSRQSSRAAFDEEHSRIERHKHRLMAMDVYSRHKELINHYYLYYPGATKRLQRNSAQDRTDYDVLRQRHRFLWDENELKNAAEKSWEFRLAKRYYDKLFKEYCIVNLSHYKKNKIALRWRIEKEVLSGKGQFECGNKSCQARDDLTSWEVNFGYVEDGQKKNALVKVRLCRECSAMLNYHSRKRKYEKKKRRYRSKSPKSSAEKTGNDGHGQMDGTDKATDKTNDVTDKADDVTDKKAGIGDKKAAADDNAVNVWKKPIESADEQKLAEEELDDFLDDMFM